MEFNSNSIVCQKYWKLFPNITWKIVLDNPDLNWDYCYLSLNPNKL